MSGLITRLKTGRALLAALGVFAAITGTTAMSSAAQADWRDRGYSDTRYGDRDDRRYGEQRRWNRIREAREREQRREAWRHRRWLESQRHYYAPQPRYYAEPGFSMQFGFNGR